MIKKYLNKIFSFKDGRGITSETLILFFIILLAFAVRFWRIWEPNSYIYDESYYAKYANMLLEGKPFMDVHPLVGELLISLGILCFGNNSFGWRIVPLLGGVLVVVLTYFIASKLFKNTRVGLVASFLVAIDGLMIVQSRYALLNIFVALFTLLTFACTIKILEEKKWYWVVLSGIAFGLGAGTQWVILPFGVVILGWLVAKLWRDQKLLWLTLSTFALTVAIVYVIQFIFAQREGVEFVKYFADWHKRAWEFHRKLKGNHVNASRWYTWLWLYNPPWYSQLVTEKTSAVVLAIGNQLIWVSALLSFIVGWISVAVSKNARKVLLLPLLAFSCFYFGWSIISREQFLYYIVPALPFYFMVLAYFLCQISKKYPAVFVAWLVGVMAIFFLFYPLYSGRTISKKYYDNLMWSHKWHAELRVAPGSASVNH